MDNFVDDEDEEIIWDDATQGKIYVSNYLKSKKGSFCWLNKSTSKKLIGKTIYRFSLVGRDIHTTVELTSEVVLLKIILTDKQGFS